jgi:Tol biopolymer transport system component
LTRARLVLALAAAVAGLSVAPAGATRIAARTSRVGSGGAGTSLRPVVSDDGREVVFDSDQAGSTGRMLANREVFLRDLRSRSITTMSGGLGGAQPNGESMDGAVSSDGKVVAFDSTASNLVADDTNDHTDVFIHVGDRVYPVSTAPDGTMGNGDSSQPDLSADGHMIVFASKASNLVAGDDNGLSDVFVRNLLTGAMTRVSQSAVGFGGDGASLAPAISPDGHFVTFASSADNLVSGDTQGLPDVFLADLEEHTMSRVSVNSHGRAQNAAVQSPFAQISDVSRGGHYVVFDSDATNLDPSDRRLHTDVFERNEHAHTTTRVSVASAKAEANSDSVYPRISPNGRFVTFESFANNLFPIDARGPDSFLVDTRLRATTLLDVTNAGRVGPSHSRQLLQRPSVSADGNVTAFASRAGLVGADGNGEADAYARRTTPARAHIHIGKAGYRVRTDDPHASFLFCHFRTLVGLCQKSHSIGRLPHGKYKLTVRPFGPGIRLGPLAVGRFRR